MRCTFALAVVLGLTSSPARADMAGPNPIPLRVAAAEVIVIGKVGQLEPRTVTTTRYPGAPEKADFAIAVVEVADPILGGKDLKKVRIGFVPPQPGVPNKRLSQFPQLNHQVGQEALYILRKHHESDFYVPQDYYAVIEKKANNFDKQVEPIKKAAQLLADPMASLKSKEAAERFQTAAMLINRYRAPRPATKTEAIDAAQSKLILEALAGADWSKRDENGLSPLALFFQLGVTEKDGWQRPQNQQELAAAAQKWCKDHAGKFVLQKLIAEKAK